MVTFPQFVHVDISVMEKHSVKCLVHVSNLFTQLPLTPGGGGGGGRPTLLSEPSALSSSPLFRGVH